MAVSQPMVHEQALQEGEAPARMAQQPLDETVALTADQQPNAGPQQAILPIPGGAPQCPHRVLAQVRTKQAQAAARDRSERKPSSAVPEPCAS